MKQTFRVPAKNIQQKYSNFVLLAATIRTLSLASTLSHQLLACLSLQSLIFFVFLTTPYSKSFFPIYSLSLLCTSAFVASGPCSFTVTPVYLSYTCILFFFYLPSFLFSQVHVFTSLDSPVPAAHRSQCHLQT